MFARMAIYDVPGDRLEDARASFQEAIARIGESPGMADALFLLNGDSGRAVTITMWVDHHSMVASRVGASRIRSEALAAVGGEIVSVDEFEVVSNANAR
jgi:hypothetical protein